MDNGRTIICNIDFVPMSFDDYECYIRQDEELGLLRDVLFRNASLSWDKKSLRFNDEKVSDMLKALYPSRFSYKLEELQSQEEEKDGTDKSGE